MSTPSKPQAQHALWKLFEKQDAVLNEHFAQSTLIREAFEVISEGCCLVLQVLPHLPFEPHKRDVLASFSRDAVSSAVVATRISLWGDVPEAMSILRPAIERSVQLRHIVTDSKYQTAGYEMEKGSFDQLSYEALVGAMGAIGKKSDQLHGLISESWAHATASRLRWSQYERNGIQYARVGVAYEECGAMLCLYYCMDVVLIVLDCLGGAYNEEGCHFEIAEIAKSLFERFRDLKKRYDLKFEELKDSA